MPGSSVPLSAASASANVIDFAAEALALAGGLRRGAGAGAGALADGASAGSVDDGYGFDGALMLGAHTSASYGETGGGWGNSGMGGEVAAGKQRFRRAMGKSSLRQRFRWCRAAAETNWFLTWVLAVKGAYQTFNVQFGDEKQAAWIEKVAREQRQFNGGRPYAFLRMVEDAFKEWNVCDSVVALWRDVGENKQLPVVTILNCEEAEVDDAFGLRTLKIDMKRRHDPGKRAELERRFGKKFAEAMITGKQVEIGDGEDGWHFDYETSGKLGHGLTPPKMVSILDDLDFIDLIKAGDWNAAYERRNIIRHGKRGYEIKGGTFGGTDKRHITGPQTQAFKRMMQDIDGLAKVVTNFDVSIDHVVLDLDKFLRSENTAASYNRIMNWGGAAAFMLLPGFSKQDGVSPYLTQAFRAEMLKGREVIFRLCERVFNHPSFLRGHVRAPELKLKGDESVLYTVAEVTSLVTSAHASGILSTRTVREMIGRVDSEESERLRAEHADRKSVTPAFEPSQGLLPGMFPEDFPGAQAKPGAQDGGAGGRPKKENTAK